MGSHYCHLKLDERQKLAKWLEAKMPIAEIADRLGRDASTIYRDIKRNRYTDTELGQTSEDGNFTVIEAECLAGCGFPTCVQINSRYFENVTPDQVPAICEHLKSKGE